MKCELCTNFSCQYRKTVGQCYYDNLTTDYIDEPLEWNKFRNEAALKIYCAELSNSHLYIRDHNSEIRSCIDRANKLIEQLKNNDC